MTQLANNTRHYGALVVLLTILCASASHAVQGPTEDGLWYYEIGGAEPVSAPANPAVVSVTLGGSAQLVQVPRNTTHAIRNVEEDILLYNVFAPGIPYKKGPE